MARVLEFSFIISPSYEYSGLISFRIDWFDLLAVEGTLKSLPQHHSSKASILWCSAFFIVQVSYPYMTIGKTIALTRRTFVLQCRRPGFNLWVRKIPWRREWQPIPEFLPGKSQGQRNLAGYSPWGCKESDTTEWLSIAYITYLKST